VAKIKISDEEWNSLTVTELRALGAPPLDDDSCVDEPGHPCEGTQYKQCQGAREDVERALYNLKYPMRSYWWAL
jgi:hypothetical protein